MKKMYPQFYCYPDFSCLASFQQSFAQEKTYVTPDVNIISVSPVQGSGMDINRVPANVQNIF